MAPTPKGLRLAGQLGGTGRDKDGGKERGVFEKERQGRMQGGSDRPPVYTPKDDGERGGYIGRSKSMAVGGGGRFAAFVSKLEAQGKDASSAKAIAATAGRKKYGNAKMSAMAAKGRK